MSEDLYAMPRRRAKRSQAVIAVAVDPAQKEAFRLMVEQQGRDGVVWMIRDGEKKDLVLCTSRYWQRRELQERRRRNRRRRG